MDRLILVTMAAVVAFSMYVGTKAVVDINDGRIQTAVNQLVNSRIHKNNVLTQEQSNQVAKK